MLDERLDEKMDVKSVTVLVLGSTLLIATPGYAKTKKPRLQGGNVTGVTCSQGPDDIFIGASELKPGIRNGLRKGQIIKINIAGYGPMVCVVR
jgi:hypothetical protein